MFIFYKNFENKMSGVQKSSKKEITNLIDNYVQNLHPTRGFLGDYFLDISDSCFTHSKRKDEFSFEEVQRYFSQAEKAADSNEANRIFLEKSKELCKMCRENDLKIPAIFNLVNKIIK
jgi:hypothetical protein